MISVCAFLPHGPPVTLLRSHRSPRVRFQLQSPFLHNTRSTRKPRLQIEVGLRAGYHVAAPTRGTLHAIRGRKSRPICVLGTTSRRRDVVPCTQTGAACGDLSASPPLPVGYHVAAPRRGTRHAPQRPRCWKSWKIVTKIAAFPAPWPLGGVPGTTSRRRDVVPYR